MTDHDYLRLACQFAAVNSDDPRTQVGAVLVPDGGRAAIVETNRIPPGVAKEAVRLLSPGKYQFLEHAERAAILRAAATGEATRGARLYCTWYACTDCARAIILAGIREVVGLASLREATPGRWEEEVSTAERMLTEAGVSRRWICDSVGGRILFDGRIHAC